MINLSNYKIIFSEETPGLSLSAEYLKSRLNEKFGISVEASSDKDCTPTEYEILIGCTNRCESKDFYPLMKYAVSHLDKSIVISCGGPFSANKAIDSLIDQLESNALADVEASLLDTEKQEFCDGADLRVMTSNILAQRWICGGRPYITYRAEIYAAILTVYSPDIIGVQETDDPWNEFFPYYLNILKEHYGLNYGWSCNRYGNLSILTSNMYNKNRFELLDESMHEFSYMNSEKYKLRVLSSSVLKEKNGSDTYLLVNTHWSGKEENVWEQINDGIKTVNAYKEKYGITNFFCTGDYNMHKYGFSEYKEGTGYTDAREAAQATGTLVNFNPGIREGIYIDHVFHTPGIEVLRYETVDKNFTDVLSDHLPQYGDFKTIK